MKKLNASIFKANGWTIVGKNSTGHGNRKIDCGYIYVKGNLQLTHDEIIDYAIVKVIGGATPGATILRGEFKTLESFNEALEPLAA